MASEPATTPVAASDLISFLKALPDCRMRRGIRFPQWWMLLVAILSILSGQGSLVGMVLRAIRQCWSIENSWHWVRDVPLREDAHRYREDNGVQILARLRSVAINALRLDGVWSITEGVAALAHDIKGLLRLPGWRPAAETPSG